MALENTKPLGAKPTASLSPTLLARKGGAKPAMRPHAAAIAAALDASPDAVEHDLGWNDMGDCAGEADIAPVVSASEVHRQQERIAREFAPRASRVRRSALAEGRKAAFTLRLDEERHLRLRLACTARNLSAQAVVTQALDQFLADHPELAAIAGELRAKRK